MSTESMPVVQFAAKNNEFPFPFRECITNKLKVAVIQVSMNAQYEFRRKVFDFIQQILGPDNPSGSAVKRGVFQKVKIEVMKKGKIFLNRIVKGSSPAIELESVFQGAKYPSLPFFFGPP